MDHEFAAVRVNAEQLLLGIGIVVGAIVTRLFAGAIALLFNAGWLQAIVFEIVLASAVAAALVIGLRRSSTRTQLSSRSKRLGAIETAPVCEPQLASTTLETFKSRRAQLSVPAREYLLSRMMSDIAQGSSEATLAIVELQDFQRLYAFDSASATLALLAFSRQLASTVGRERCVAHVNQGAFAIWFAGLERQAAHAELRAICYALGAEITDADLSFVPEIGVRTAHYPADGAEAEELLTLALVAGTDPFEEIEAGTAIDSPTLAQHARELYSIEQHLRHAVERHELELEFQPIVDVERLEFSGAESLVRWNHPTLGRVSPSRFVPILEENGLIDEVGMWILDSACRSCRKWHDQGLAGLTVAVNLSARQAHAKTLVKAVERTLERHGLPARALTLELTETAAMQDEARTLSLFRSLKEIGVRLSIDDFGTGYSSLSYLLKLPFDKLKIDREFVVDIQDKPGSQAICRALCELASGLGIGLIAEGAETEREVSTLQQLGCRLIQGYYFSRPVADLAFLSMALSRTWVPPQGSSGPSIAEAARPVACTG